MSSSSTSGRRFERQRHRQVADGAVGVVALGVGHLLEGLGAQDLAGAGHQADGGHLVAVAALADGGLVHGLADQQVDLALGAGVRQPARDADELALLGVREPELERLVVGLEVLLAADHGEAASQVQALAVEPLQRRDRPAEGEHPAGADGQATRAQQPAEPDQPLQAPLLHGAAHSASSTSSSLARTSSRSSWSLSRAPSVASTTPGSSLLAPRKASACDQSMVSATPGRLATSMARSRATARATCRASTSETSGARTRTIWTSRSIDGWSIKW